MNIPSLIAIVAAALMIPASALTADDIAPASLPGKSFIFTITSSEGIPVRTGVWKGTFGEAPSSAFTITNLSGNTPDHPTTYFATSSPDSPSTTIQLPKIIGGGEDYTQLYLTVTGNAGTFTKYTLAPDTSYSVQYGTFALEGAAAPEISVRQPVTKELTDGKASVAFGSVKTGKSGVAKTFYITNRGTAALTGLKLAPGGTNKADFVVGILGETSLAPGATAQFKVTFKPKAKGAKSASIQVKSNDADENPFDIKLTGTGAK